MEEKELENISEYLTVKDAAKFLGVSGETLRRWDRQGKLKAYRHPLNRYRLYKKDELMKLLQDIQKPQEGDQE